MYLRSDTKCHRHLLSFKAVLTLGLIASYRTREWLSPLPSSLLVCAHPTLNVPRLRITTPIFALKKSSFALARWFHVVDYIGHGDTQRFQLLYRLIDYAASWVSENHPTRIRCLKGSWHCELQSTYIIRVRQSHYIYYISSSKLKSACDKIWVLCTGAVRVRDSPTDPLPVWINHMGQFIQSLEQVVWIVQCEYGPSFLMI